MVCAPRPSFSFRGPRKANHIHLSQHQSMAASNISLQSSRQTTPARPAQTHRPTLSQTYAQAVANLARKTHLTSLYPGQNFQRLAEFLSRPYGSFFPPVSGPIRLTLGEEGDVMQAPEHDNHNFVTVYHFSNATNSTSRGPSISKYHIDAPGRMSFEQNRPPLGLNCSQLLFMRGYATPEWMNLVGCTFRVDPDYFRRHLSFLQLYELFDMPCLPSASTNFVSLPLVTNVTRGAGAGDDGISAGVDLSRDQEDINMKIGTYLRQLERNCGMGQSIIRKVHVQGKKYYSVEQELSIAVEPKSGGWTAIIWLDCGIDPLEKQLREWLTLPSRSQPLPHDLLPVFQFREKNAAKVDDSASGARPNFPQHQESTANHARRALSEVAQSANLLHSDYGQTLDPVIMQTDAFYAISELFAFSSCSENQFLNLLGLTIDRERHPHLGKMQASLANLEATRNVLEGHIRKQEATIVAIHSRGSSNWPRAANPEHVKIVNNKVETLLLDWQHVLTRSQILRAQCMDSTNLLMNQAMLAEAQRSISQAEGLARLTFLAFLFVPLSFTTSFFGMNFRELIDDDGPNLSVYVWFAVSVPIFAMSLSFLFWERVRDYLAQKGIWAS